MIDSAQTEARYEVKESFFDEAFARIQKKPVTFKWVGDLTIRKITQPATFDVTATLNGDTLSGTATAVVFAKDFGFDAPNVANILKVEDGFTIVIDFVAKEG